MAQRVQVMLIDDVDQTEASETVSFGLDGVTYEIDLTSENAERLRNDFAPWVGHAERTGGRKSTRAAGSRIRKGQSEVRNWARDQGYDVSDRGRISSEIQAAYDKAH